MADWDRDAFENALIEDMRAHGGTVTSGPLAGHPLLILASTGAKSGTRRRAILTYSRDGEDYVVAGTAGGSPVVPAWVHNIAATPKVEVDLGTGTFPATATVVNDEARAALWDRHVAALPHFAAYPAQVNRVIPMIRIRPVAG